MLTFISFTITAPLILISGLPQEALWGMEHFLIAVSMAVIGLFATMSWESIFPERKDMLILGPLPVRNSTLFLAKISAISMALGAAILFLNSFTGLGWALQFEPSHGGFLGLTRSIGAYWTTVTLASAFVFGGILTIQGLVSVLLPRQLYLQLSSALQMASFVAILIDFVLEPSLETTPALTAAANQHLLHEFPSYWFLGLFQSLNGSISGNVHTVFVSLAQRAWTALAVTTAGGLISVMMAYVRATPRIIEDPEIKPALSGWSRKIPTIGDPLHSAILSFSWRTLMRSRQHRLIMGFFLSVGLTVLSLTLKSPAGGGLLMSGSWSFSPAFLAATFMAIGMSVSGTRIIVAIPVMLKANWIFQMTQVHASTSYQKATRRALFSIGVLPIWITVAGLTLWKGSVWMAAVHLAVLGILGFILVDASMFSLHKLPFVCYWMPGRTSIVMFFLGGMLLGVRLAISAATYELKLLQMRYGGIWLFGGLCLAAGILHWRLAKSDKGLTYEEEEAPAIISLKLDA
ncbi:hypothetical protein [Silvibacterium acidisoli]|uniref:hypothetical protein n=1 Tax=Acidobacteriaceae bacterium ZG23-2 TaxID=2883246 RepID=UPI00406CC390